MPGKFPSFCGGDMKPYNHRTYEDLSMDLDVHEQAIAESRITVPPMDEARRFAHILEANRLRKAIKIVLKDIYD